ncbi:MAG: hypothetical protein ACI9UA_002864 [Pseudoalteromonas tetraodonis]
MNPLLQPLPYHLRLRDFLKGNHREVWDWFSSAEAESDYSDAVQLELLKSTYRLDRAAHEAIYAVVDEVKDKLGLLVPVTLYQMQDAGGPGQAALYFTPGHGHVVFGGKILDLLDADERRALVGHELAHFKLWTEEGGEFLVADRILLAMAGDGRAEPSHHESARLYRLFTEIYADRGSVFVTGSPESAIGALIKTVTGTSDIAPASYLAQADEVVERSGQDLKSSGFTHPEEFLRAKSITLWASAHAEEAETGSLGETEAEIERMIIGRCSLDSLDLTQQERLSELTRETMRHLLEPAWIRTGRTLAHAKLYFSDFDPGEPRLCDSMQVVAEKFGACDEKTRHYLAHILLDFSVADRDLEENGLAAGVRAADALGVSVEFDAGARKELKVLKRDLTAIRKNLDERFKRAGEEHAALSKREQREFFD